MSATGFVEILAPVTKKLAREIPAYEGIVHRAFVDRDLPKVIVTRQILSRLYAKAVLTGGYGA